MLITFQSALRTIIITSIIVWRFYYNTKEGRLKASGGGALPISQ